MQLWVEMNLHRVAPGFLKHVRQEERAELVNDFATAASANVAAIDVEGILCDDG